MTPDLIIIILILLSIIIGIIRGFIKETISLVTWIVAIVLAINYAEPLSTIMTFTKREFVRTITAFLLIFVGVGFLGALMNALIGNFIRKTPFSIPDRVLGSMFGFLRGCVLVTLLVLLAGLTPFPETTWWEKSYTIAKFEEVAIWFKERLPENNELAFHFPREHTKEKGKDKHKGKKDNEHQLTIKINDKEAPETLNIED